MRPVNLIIFFSIVIHGCSNTVVGENDSEMDAGAEPWGYGDTDGDTDSDGDTDADTDSDSDSDSDGDTDADTDSDSDSDTDMDADSDTDTDSNTEAETESETPNCSGAIPISCGDRLSDTTVGGRPNEWRAWNCTARGVTGPEKIYLFEPDDNYEVEARLTDVSAELGLFLNPDCESMSGMGVADECGYAFTFTAVAGEPQFLIVDGFEEAGGSYTLSLDCTETGDSDTATDTDVTDPPGFWRYGDWHGCAWALVTATGELDRISPEDFEEHEAGEPYCVSGGIIEEEGIAALGFNLNESAATADCGYNALVLEEPPPGVVLGGSGIALNYTVTHASLPEFRIQLTSPLGDSVDGETWCADLTSFYLGGSVFIPYTDFNTKCWDGSGEAFDPETPISSVAFVIVGGPSDATFNYCINGFAAGDSVDDAPESF